MPKRSFIKGRKQELEIFLWYYWLHNMGGDNGYRNGYIEKGLPSFQQNQYVPEKPILKELAL